MNKEDCMGQRHINEVEYVRLDDYLSGRGKEKEWLSLAGIVGGEGKNLSEEGDGFSFCEVAFEKPMRHIHINLQNTCLY